MPVSLAGQVALVTGASSGIGKGIACALAAAGATVGINHYASREAAESVVEQIAKAGGKAEAFGGDVSDEQQVISLLEDVSTKFGAIDIVVANAGRQAGAPIGDMTLKQWNDVIALDLTGAFLCGREAIRHFRKQGRRNVSKAMGKLLFTSSVHAVVPWAGQTNYAVAKAGADMLMRSLAQEVSNEGIRINAIAPSTVPKVGQAGDLSESQKKLLSLIPYGRFCEVEDIARAASWLVSDEADFVVGTTLFVDGGMTLSPEFRNIG